MSARENKAGERFLAMRDRVVELVELVTGKRAALVYRNDVLEPESRSWALWSEAEPEIRFVWSDAHGAMNLAVEHYERRLPG